VHVPVDSTRRAMRRIAAAHLQYEADGEGGVRLVRKKMRVGAVEIADEFLRPVALLAGLLGGAQIFDRRWDRTLVSARERAVELMHAVDFGFHEGGSAGADMTI